MSFDDLLKIIPYNEGDLDTLLHEANLGYTPKNIIKEKRHYAYLKEFLGKTAGLNAQFVVIEKDYVSRDYLSDYTSYYATCYEDYKKKCTRLHFFTSKREELLSLFKEKFYNSLVEGALKNREHQDFWTEDYLGYIVIKPIPYRFMGFTLLKHYNFKTGANHYKDSRDYWGVKHYKIHLFGNELEIQSLAFQEQDRNVAACATISIWCMLQRAAEDYFVILKSPSEITGDAGLTHHDGNRQFPNSGLSVPAMCNAIAKNGMVTIVRWFKDYEKGFDFNGYLRKLIHAYSTIKIPLILVLRVPGIGNKMFGHAVTISGHKKKDKESDQSESICETIKGKILSSVVIPEINYRASEVEKFYAHDDQWGAFSRMEFVGNDKLNCPWSIYNPNKILCEPIALIIPAYPKVRIDYDVIEKIVIQLNELISQPLEDEIQGKLIWDIKLMLSEDVKAKIQNTDLLDDKAERDKKLQLKFLTTPLPRYVWLASFCVDDNTIGDFMFDATGLIDGSLLINAIFYYDEIKSRLIEYLENTVARTNNEYLQAIFVEDIHSIINKLKMF